MRIWRGSHHSLTPVLVLLMASVVAWFAGACGEPADEQATPPAATSSSAPAPSRSPSPVSSAASSPGASASPSRTPVSWDWIRTRQYREWERPSGWQKRRTTTSPHSEAKIIYVDPAAAAAIGSGKSRFPAGATIVKEGYDASGQLAIFAVMQRLPGRGWLFAEYRSGGEVVEEGENPPLCTQCHVGEQDGVLAFSLD